MSIPEIILLIASIIVALSVIFTAFRKIRRGLRKVDQLLLLLDDMTVNFTRTPNAFQILEQIIAEFRTNSGSSLKDQINTIEKAIIGLTEVAKRNEQAAAILESNVETVRELTTLDRRQSAVERARIMQLLQYLEGGVAAGAATGLRLEETALHVAEDLAERDAAADSADNTPGKAADAAAHSKSTN